MKRLEINLTWCLFFMAALFFTGCTKDRSETLSAKGNNVKGVGSDALLVSAASIHEQSMAFSPGEGNYHSFRLPSIAYTKNGVYVAVCEGRNGESNDYAGNTNIVCKRSLNGGTSWVSLQSVATNGSGTYGNPTLLYDPNGGVLGKGRLWVFATYADSTITNFSQIGPGQQPVYIYYHDDEANPSVAWTRLTTIPQSAIVPNGTTADVVGPGIGIKLQNGTTAGKLVIPALNRNIVSNNGGATWSFEPLSSNTNEAAVVEVQNGFVMRNDRAKGTQWEANKYRTVRRPDPVTGVLGASIPDTNLPDPKCQGSILRYSYTGGTNGSGAIVFCNSDSKTTRYNMRVRMSEDYGVSWPKSRLLYGGTVNGKGGYSSMIRVNNNAIGLLVEHESVPGGSSTANHFSIAFHKIDLNWIAGL